MKLYGNLINRLEEGQTIENIQQGTDITMYYWSDRNCYYVTKVENQKHIWVKPYEVIADREKEGGMGHQNWLYFKTAKEMNNYLKKYGLGHDEVHESKEQEWVYRYNHWCQVTRKHWLTGKTLEKPLYTRLQPVSFGVRDYYYDWEF